MALLILAGCELAGRIGGAVGVRKAIDALPYTGDQITFPLTDSKRKPLPYPRQPP